MKKSLSLHVIAKNEAHNLKELIDSVKYCVDEIYLTDTGSTDSTIELAKNLGCTVSNFTWINDFSAARNYNFAQGKTDYQLWLDCDDKLINQDYFKLWRDELMPLSDYHLAKYHYANDGKGNPTCTFLRERVIKRGIGLKWEYFLHEGIKPIPGIRQDLAQTWAVWHRRSPDDLAADRSRNLMMFKGRERLLDPRMTMYYGKELYEGGFPDYASVWLEKAITLPLEGHDLLIGHQYLGYSYYALAMENMDLFKKHNDQQYHSNALKYFEDAAKVCLKGLLLDPNRAEFTITLSDIYMQTSQFAKAIPWLSMAKNSKPNLAMAANGSLFHAADAYGIYPSTQLVKALANVGDWQSAKNEATNLVNNYKTEEGKALLEEINKVLGEAKAPKEKLNTSDIVITCPPNPVPFEWDGKTYREKFCGGSETAAVELAENMAKLSGRKVKIFQPRAEKLIYEGVEYIPVSELQAYFENYKPYLHIAWRHSVKLTDAYTILWCHDLFTPGADQINNYDVHACLTPFHKRLTMARMGLPESKIWVTRNGLNPEKFKGDAVKKDPFLFVFSSSPDRGLDRAIRVLDRVREIYPEVKLRVHYGIEHLEKYGLGELQRNLKQMMDSRPWIQYVGKTSQPDLIKSFKESAYCVQPSDFIETSMISAMERLACGVYQIIRNVGAVQDTLKWASENDMAKLIDSDCITEKEHDLYADHVIKAIEREAYKKVAFDPESVSWEKVAQDWLQFRAGIHQK